MNGWLHKSARYIKEKGVWMSQKSSTKVILGIANCHKISFMIDISVGSIRKDSLSKIPLLRSVLPFF